MVYLSLKLSLKETTESKINCIESLKNINSSYNINSLCILVLSYKTNSIYIIRKIFILNIAFKVQCTEHHIYIVCTCKTTFLLAIVKNK